MSVLIHKTLIVEGPQHGQRIDRLLAELMPAYSRSQIKQWIDSKQILLNQKPCQAKDKVRSQDEIFVQVEESKDYLEEKNWQAEALDLDRIYEDEAILVINKPAGLIVHPGAGHYSGTVVNALLHHYPESRFLPRAGIVHRLDKDTTGLMVIAKTLEAHHQLIQQIQAREVKRQYIALVQGHVPIGGMIETAFGRHPQNRLKMAVRREGKEAITHYDIREAFPNFTLLDVQLQTGRTHQIRVHMAHIKHPIIGDPLYGHKPPLPQNASEELKASLADFDRQALHAAVLELKHPLKDETLALEAALPDDFQHLLQVIGEFYADDQS